MSNSISIASGRRVCWTQWRHILQTLACCRLIAQQRVETALFDHLRRRWLDLLGASFEVLLYDLTSAYFESSQPDDEDDKRRYRYSRDKRSVQAMVALIVTPDGFPLAL
jgi:hypothetical protein